jgi:hypothetical protein
MTKDYAIDTSPILRVQATGRCAELVIDTGHTLSTGRNWLAFAKVPCTNVYTARILSENLARRIELAVEKTRLDAYYEGYRAARRGQPPRPEFDGVLREGQP